MWLESMSNRICNMKLSFLQFFQLEQTSKRRQKQRPNPTALCRLVAGLKGELLPKCLDERWVISPRKGHSLRHRDGRRVRTEIP